MSASTKLAEDILILLDRGLTLDYVRLHLCYNAAVNLRQRLTNTLDFDIIKSVVIADVTKWRHAMQQVNTVRGKQTFNENAFAEVLELHFPELYAAAQADAQAVAPQKAKHQNNTHTQ